ncbi:glycosyltransferase family A protein [Sulfitobacter sp. F26169L]|uniref:glycosyltransferase family 2 protein n=1 Tax=Sulfitobacter sp. F26169L TaxID=2996015 RepID=UPI002260F5E0|nr:glycosyltransferase family A protein [Sulfitobacter sp. F26169L]MCX7568042.1 glycosyltransferase family A protein [Sulfitobacter sp. F26169L]
MLPTTDQIRKDAERIRASPLFDAKWYLATYPDVAQSTLPPAEHFAMFGALLLRDPGPDFNSAEYLKKHQTVMAAGQNPLLHHLDTTSGQTGTATPAVAAPKRPFVPRSPSERKGKDHPLGTDFAAMTLARYGGPVAPVAGTILPRVSVVMTCYNAADTIGGAVRSLLNQDYPDLEVVICDDNSTDDSWQVLCELRDLAPKAVKIFRVNTNGGTYLAKNICISQASGEIIMFQDSDDYSHPARVMTQVLPLLSDENLIATRSKYLRFNPDTGRIVPVADLYAKYGLITLAVRRKAFEETGYFDPVRKAGDDEWFQRLRHLYGRLRIKEIDVSLYMAELRENSLIADMLTFREDGSVDQASSQLRRNYVKIFQKRFEDKAKRRAWYRANFPPYPLRPLRTYPDTIAAIEAPPAPIVATVCCIPARIDGFSKVIAQLLPQVDELHVFLDKFDTVPEFLQNIPKVHVVLSKDLPGDPRDNAKFVPFNDAKKRLGKFYFITCDDDIFYPHDYVRTHVNRLQAYDNSVISGFHGVLCEEKPKKYFRRRFIYHFQHHALRAPQLVSNLGTGTVAFHSDCFDQLTPSDWAHGGMVDIYFSNECRRRNIAMLCMDRHTGWMRDIEETVGTPTLFGEFGDKEHLILNELGRQPYWGYRAIEETINAQDAALRDKLRALLPLFGADLKVSSFYQRYRG